MAQPDRVELLSRVNVKKAVLILALPTVISQLVNVAYNLADIFFVGQIGDPNKVAAVSLVMPAFMVTTALGNLFGIGGSSAISRAMGKGDMELARKHSTFCFYGSVAAAALFALLLFSFMEEILFFYGASNATLPFALEYTLWVLVVGAIPSVTTVAMAHMLRADGKPRVASIGLSTGSLVNVALDYIFIMFFQMGVTGVALATLISNLGVFAFFIAYWLRNKENLVVSLDPKNIVISKEIYQPVMAAGIPAAVQTFVVSLFFMFINRQASNYSDIHVAAVGIVQKLDMIPSNVTLGLSQGIIPLLGYNFAAKNYKRMEEVSMFALKCAVSFAVIYVVMCELFAKQLVTWFIPGNLETIELGTRFTRIMCVCTPFMAICNVMNSAFQGTGQAKQALSVCLFRKVYVGLPVLYLLDWLLPEIGILIVMTVVDAAASVYVFYLYKLFKQRLKSEVAQ